MFACVFVRIRTLYVRRTYMYANVHVQREGKKAMAWFKMHQELGRHPKLKRFARRLGISEAAAIGHLFLLWGWAIDYAQDGDLSRFTHEDIADAAGWGGDPDQLIDALLFCPPQGNGFLDRAEDGGLILHEWEEHCGAEFAKREREAQRLRRYRAGKKEVKKETGTQENGSDDAERTQYVHSTNVVRTSGEERKGKERKGKEILALASIEAKVVPAIAGTDSAGQSETQKQPEKSGEAATQKTADTQNTQEATGSGCTLSQVIVLWNAELAALGFPKVQKGTPARERAFTARVAEQAARRDLGWWRERIAQLARSEFMRASAREKANWLTFDWLLNENNLVKVQEGKYDSDRVTRPRSQPRMSLADMPDDIDAFEAALGMRKGGGKVISLDADYRELGEAKGHD